MCAIIISLGAFFNFKILIFQVDMGLKGQKMALNQKSSACLTLYLRNRRSYDCDFLVHMCKMISPVNVFIFQNFDLGDFMGVKRQKMT